MSKYIFWIAGRKYIMSKAKAKLEQINEVIKPEASAYVKNAIAALTPKRPTAPALRWLCVKEPKLFRSGEFILQYKADDGNWYEVPEVSMVS